MKCFRVSLVAAKSLFFCSEIETKLNTSSVKRSSEDDIGTIILKCDIYEVFQTLLACDHAKIILLYTSYITQVYFTLNLFTIYVAIFKI